MIARPAEGALDVGQFNSDLTQLQNHQAKISVASLVWKLPSELHEVQGKVVQALGFDHQFFYADDAIPSKADIILVQGPYGTLVSLARQLLKIPTYRRPVLAYWFQQSLDLSWPERIGPATASVFSVLNSTLGSGRRGTHSLRRVTNAITGGRGARLGFLGDILWLHQTGLLDILALSSTVYADYFAEHGVKSIVIPRGHHGSYGANLGQKRSTAAVWMGKLRSRRRARSVLRLQSDIENRGRTMQVYDGRKRAFIFAARRMQILNRAWFVPNIFFSGPTDELSIRFFIAAANGAVVITEPGLNRYPFIPGRHIVECSVEEMPEQIEYYIEHEEQWKKLSREMHVLVTEKLTLESSLSQVMASAMTCLSRKS